MLALFLVMLAAALGLGQLIWPSNPDGSLDGRGVLAIVLLFLAVIAHLYGSWRQDHPRS